MQRSHGTSYFNLKSQVAQVVKYQPRRLCAWVGGRGLGWGGEINLMSEGFSLSCLHQYQNVSGP